MAEVLLAQYTVDFSTAALQGWEFIGNGSYSFTTFGLPVCDVYNTSFTQDSGIYKKITVPSSTTRITVSTKMRATSLLYTDYCSAFVPGFSRNSDKTRSWSYSYIPYPECYQTPDTGWMEQTVEVPASYVASFITQPYVYIGAGQYNAWETKYNLHAYINYIDIKIYGTTGNLAFTVLDSRTNGPVASAYVVCKNAGGSAVGFLTTDSSGQATLNNQSPGTYTYQVSSNNFLTSSGSVTVTAGNTTSTTIVLYPATQLYLIVG